MQKKVDNELDKIPNYEPPNLNGLLERKLQIYPKEFGEESSYGSDESAALYCFLQPTQGPYIIIPSLDKPEVASEFDLKSKYQLNK